MNYASLIWGQNLNAVSRIVILQKKALKIMHFQSRDSHFSPLYKIFKPSYKIDSYGKKSNTIGAINSWSKNKH